MSNKKISGDTGAFDDKIISDSFLPSLPVHRSANRAAIFYTLLATAELKGLEPKYRFKALLKKLPIIP